MRLGWLLSARGFTWLRAGLCAMVVVAGVGAAAFGLDGGFHESTAMADRALLTVLLAVVTVSIGLSFLLVTDAATNEATTARSLFPWRVGLIGLGSLSLCWPLAIAPLAGWWLALQCIATGWLMFGTAAVLVGVSRRWFALGQALYVGASLLPGLLPREWNLLHPSRHGWPYLGFAAGLVVLGLMAYGLAGPAKGDSG